MMLDRSAQPAIQPFSPTALPRTHIEYLRNGIAVHLVQYGTTPVIELQAVFRAGRSYEERVGEAGYMAAMLTEGTARHTGLQLSQALDAAGAWISPDTDAEYLGISLTTLPKHLHTTLPLLHDVLLEPTFPKMEWDQMKRRNLQRMQVDARRTAYLAGRKFRHQLFGATHPYGMHIGAGELAELELSHLTAYHSNYLGLNNVRFVAAGSFDEKELLRELDQQFGSYSIDKAPRLTSLAQGSVPMGNSGRHHLPLEGMQSSLRLGHLGFPRSHPDYYAMNLVNTLFGGYFGSRLMRNIREDKGYTYGIYSAWMSEAYDGYLLITADVGNEYVEDTIAQVKIEMRRLMDEPVPADELELVKQYITGESLRKRETPFQIAELLSFSLMNNLDFSELNKRYEIIHALTVEDVQRLAQTYYKPDNLLEIVCGGEATL